MKTANLMRNIKVEKVTLNIGTGKEQSKLDKALVLLKNITGIEPVKTVTQKRIPTWGIRPGLPIGCKITLRGQSAKKLLIRLLKAKSNTLKNNNFDENGSVSFGIHEYIDIPNAKYDPQIGIMGLQTSITLQRSGFRIKNRKICKKKINKRHIITQLESIEYFKKEFNINVEQ